MRIALCSLLLCWTTVVLGQSHPQNPQPQNQVPVFVPAATLHLLRPYGMACPVGMKAERQASGQREWIVSLDDGLQPQRLDTKTNTAGVHVELAGFTGKAMRQAEVEVYYMAPGVHMLPAGQFSADPAPSSDLKKTFVLSAADGDPALQLSASFFVSRAASITRVRLLSITYSDGSTWQAKSGSDCTVTPGLLMAVARR